MALLPLTQAAAQNDNIATPEQVMAIPPGGCPAGGYSKPIFHAFGPNGDSQMGYEIAGPCVGLELRKAAIATGMARMVPLGVKNVSRARFSAEGVIQGVTGAKVTAFMSYQGSGMRLVLEGAGPRGAVKEVRVFSGAEAWNESAPGEGESAAPAGALAERQAMLKLTPHGALWSLIEAEGHAKVTQVGGKTVITGASPYDRIPVTVTLGADDRPELVQVTHGGHRYEARFFDYADHWDTGTSPNYLVFFPRRLVWTVDGRPMAELTTTDFKQNAYMVFPRPSQIAAMAEAPAVRGDLLKPVVDAARAAAAAGQVFLKQPERNEPYTPPPQRLDPNLGLAIMRSVPQGETPRGADGKPVLEGAWSANYPVPVGDGEFHRDVYTNATDQATTQRANLWNLPLYKPENWEKVHALDFSTIEVDPVFACGGRAGTPREGPPTRIALVEDEIWLFYGTDLTRVIKFNRVLDADAADFFTWWGVSSAKWEGDTLLIDSVGYTEESWLRWQGYFHSGLMTVQERLRREGNLLYWQATVYDPDTFIQPWTTDVSVRRAAPRAPAPGEGDVCSERDAESIFDKYFRG
jgi:hypothetical protein